MQRCISLHRVRNSSREGVGEGGERGDNCILKGQADVQMHESNCEVKNLGEKFVKRPWQAWDDDWCLGLERKL